MDLVGVSRPVLDSDITAWKKAKKPVTFELLNGSVLALPNGTEWDQWPERPKPGDRLVWMGSAEHTRRVLISAVEAPAVATWPPVAALYAEGSAACRNYSTLTKDLRVLAGQLLIGYAVAGGLFLSNVQRLSPAPEAVAVAGLVASIVLFLFNAALWRVNLHYGTAFLAVRDCLARIEGGRDGPWGAHKHVRRWPRDEWAYAAPFVALGGITSAGLVAIATWWWQVPGAFGALALVSIVLVREVRKSLRFLRRIKRDVEARADAMGRAAQGL